MGIIPYHLWKWWKTIVRKVVQNSKEKAKRESESESETETETETERR